MDGKLYSKRDIISQGEFYTRHVMAMTAEALHDKSSIAAELAHRDRRIAELEAALSEAITLIQDWGAYADEYFQHKHDLAGDVARLRTLLNQERDDG